MNMSHDNTLGVCGHATHTLDRARSDHAKFIFLCARYFCVYISLCLLPFNLSVFEILLSVVLLTSQACANKMGMQAVDSKTEYHEICISMPGPRESFWQKIVGTNNFAWFSRDRIDQA